MCKWVEGVCDDRFIGRSHMLEQSRKHPVSCPLPNKKTEEQRSGRGNGRMKMTEMVKNDGRERKTNGDVGERVFLL